jgi:hypothetical protein
MLLVAQIGAAHIYNYVNGTSDGHVNKISMQNMEKDPFLK